MPHFDVNNLIDLLAAWGMAAVLFDMRRHDPGLAVTTKSRLLFSSLFFFFLLRAMLLAWPSRAMDVIAYLPACVLPSAELIFVEGVLGRQSPAWLRRPVFAASLVFAVLNVGGLRLDHPAVENAFTLFVLSTLAALALFMGLRARARLSTLENRFIDAIFASCAIAVPLAFSDFIPLGEYSLHLGGLAALLMAHTLSRVTGRSDSLGVLVGELAVLLIRSCIIAVFFQVALQDFSLHSLLRTGAMAAAFMLLLTMLGHHRILAMRRREDSFLKWCLRLQTSDVNEFVEALRDFPLTQDHEVIRLGDLQGFAQEKIKARLAGERSMASLEQLKSEAEGNADSAETLRLLRFHGMSHAFRVHGDLGVYLLFRGVEIGGDGYQRQKLELIQRMAMSLEARDQLSRRDESLRQAQKMEALGRLAAGISHEFGNLLMVIKGFASAVRRSPGLSSAAAEDADEILKAGERASGVTRQLLAFSRQQVLKRERVDLVALLRANQSMLAPLLSSRLSVEMRLPDGAVEVLADSLQLDQVILNLVLNARDAMPEGGSITIELMQEAHVARLKVRDDGQGMDAATVQRIFEPYFSTKASGSGTGLGLATVLGIIEQSGGSVSVKSEAGRGSEFEILLPLAR